MILYTKVWTENNPGKGEDANPPQTERIAAVFDGLGGSGGFVHRSVNRTSAYMGSRIFARGFEDYFAIEARVEEPFQRLEHGEALEDVLRRFGANLSMYLAISSGQWMQKYKIDFEEKPRSKSSKLLPTTMAGAVFREHEDTVEIISVWAGDSRTFLFHADGLKQISMDDEALGEDEKNRDYWEFLHLGDVRMSNHLSMSNEFCLRLKYLKVKKPCLVISGSDGTFGYVKEPLDLECLWMDEILRAGSLEELSENLRQYYVKDHHDDCSLTINAFGFAEYGALKAFVQARRSEYERLYLKPLGGAARYAQLEEEKKTARKRLMENGEKVRKVLMPYVEKEFFDWMSGGKKPEICDVENQAEKESVENQSQIEFSLCPQVQEVQKQLERAEAEQNQKMKALEENDSRKELLWEIQKNWISVRMAFETERRPHVSRKSEEWMHLYKGCMEQYDDICSKLKERMSEYQQDMRQGTEALTNLMEQMKRGTAGTLVVTRVKQYGRKFREYAERCGWEYKKNHKTLQNLKRDMENYASKIVDEDVQNADLMSEVMEWVLEKDEWSFHAVSDNVIAIKRKISENEKEKDRVRTQIADREQVRRQAYIALFCDKKEELYLWAVNRYSELLLNIFKKQNPNEMLTEELERQIAELNEQQKTFEPYKDVTWKSLWNAYQPGFEEYLHMPCVASIPIVPRDEYLKYMEKQRRKREEAEAAKAAGMTVEPKTTEIKMTAPEAAVELKSAAGAARESKNAEAKMAEPGNMGEPKMTEEKAAEEGKMEGKLEAYSVKSEG